VFENPQINLYVADVEVSARFYREHFGFVETFRAPKQGRPDHIELRLGGLVLGFGSIEALREVHGVEVSSGGPPRGEVVLWTDDVDSAYADLTAKGVTELSPPHDFLGTTLRATWFADPDGNPVHLVMRRRDGSE
jgi:lactoylglutathione lyase